MAELHQVGLALLSRFGVDGFGVSYVKQLNKDADEYTTYKVVYIARHGEGYHNLVGLLSCLGLPS